MQISGAKVYLLASFADDSPSFGGIYSTRDEALRAIDRWRSNFPEDMEWRKSFGPYNEYTSWYYPEDVYEMIVDGTVGLYAN